MLIAHFLALAAASAPAPPCMPGDIICATFETKTPVGGYWVPERADGKIETKPVCGPGVLPCTEAKAIGHVVCVTRTNTSGQTFLTMPLKQGLPRNVLVSARVSAENVVSGATKWRGGQFHVVHTSKGIENFPKSDFEGSFGFQPLSFPVSGIEPTDTLVLRIGLQNGAGRACFDDIRIMAAESEF